MDGDKAQEFLDGFLVRLMQANETNKKIVAQNVQLIRQNEKVIGLLETVSRGMDGLAWRADRLARILCEDETGLEQQEDLSVPIGEHLRDYATRTAGRVARDIFWGSQGGGRQRRR